MPVTVSSLALSCVIDHDGLIRRSEETAVEVMKIGTSRAVVQDEEDVAAMIIIL